eukprot:scaffold143991_cov46-Prasinocladus_malaysianus.AAC.1
MMMCVSMQAAKIKHRPQSTIMQRCESVQVFPAFDNFMKANTVDYGDDNEIAGTIGSYKATGRVRVLAPVSPTTPRTRTVVNLSATLSA